MRELILLRHAHAESATAGQDDIARPLSATGLAEARAAGDWLREHGLRPDRVLCSTATRTRDTLAALGDIGGAEVHEDASIYDASPGTLVALADANRDAERLLLVGHNPGLEQLAALVHSGQTGDYRGMPPGGIAVLRLPMDVNIEPGIATLTQFWWP
ncbi:MAG TPA: histidine phosphatase family protein [Thermomonas sp.]|jgi:phosphohistidine phosphatase SixA|uniref:SixA phosphatase family protein n=1 Tax=Thermomonas sp. TaxID=1971895 RepID=UPI002BD86D85|nr:histidine phosphatase family protein [Thermomonas sp.]HOU64729.1 histidine phosphatase family protein [Thermomonas sp.]HPM56173.1 histidine phosphatase family protein [Thermomonas sp.]HPW12737.1 histidine phosphatase family protein [Thermomonas sp.]